MNFANLVGLELQLLQVLVALEAHGERHVPLVAWPAAAAASPVGEPAAGDHAPGENWQACAASAHARGAARRRRRLLRRALPSLVLPEVPRLTLCHRRRPAAEAAFTCSPSFAPNVITLVRIFLRIYGTCAKGARVDRSYRLGR